MPSFTTGSLLTNEATSVTSLRQKLRSPQVVNKMSFFTQTEQNTSATIYIQRRNLTCFLHTKFQSRYFKIQVYRQISIAIFFTFFCSGCFIPVPHRRLHVYGVMGQIVSATDNQPVAGASIYDSHDPTATVCSDAEGNFRLRAQYGWHGAYCIGPISLSLLPGWDRTGPYRKINVTASGYQPAEFAIGAGMQNTNQPTKITGAYLQAGQLQLVPRLQSDGVSH